jgi:hypothetical protein
VCRWRQHRTHLDREDHNERQSSVATATRSLHPASQNWSPRENGGLSRPADDTGCGKPSSLLVSTQPKASKRACPRRDSPPAPGTGRHPDDEVDADPPGTPAARDFCQPSVDRNRGSGCHRCHPYHRAGPLSPSNATVTASVRWRVLALGLLVVLPSVGARYPGGCLLMALYGRDLMLPLTGHLDGTSGRRWSKSGPLHGQAQSGALPDIRRPRKVDQ